MILQPAQPSLSASRADMVQLSACLQQRPLTLARSSVTDDDSLDGLITKPWGEEYRVYADPFYDIWLLSLAPGQSTSLHCHPRKVTALIPLSGRGILQFLTRPSQQLAPLTVWHLGRGVFHTTINSSEQEPLVLIEVEVPRDKGDLVRLKDRYGRAGTSYEQPGPEDLPALEEMKHCAHRPGARLRASCLHHRYQFAVRQGDEILDRPEPERLLCVSLSIEAAIEQSILVFPRYQIPPQIVQSPQQSYLTVSLQNQEERRNVHAS